jgi:hypothetical protein
MDIIKHLVLPILWLIGFCLSLRFLNELEYFSGKYKWWLLFSSLFSWMTLLVLLLWLSIEDTIKSIKENF